MTALETMGAFVARDIRGRVPEATTGDGASST